MKSQMSYCRRDHRWWLCLRDLCRSGVPIIAILCMGLLPGCVFLPSVKDLERREDMTTLATCASKTPGFIISDKQAADAEAAMLRIFAQWAQREDGGYGQILDYCKLDRPVRMRPCWGVSEKENRVRKESYEGWVREYVRLVSANGRPTPLILLLKEAGSWEELAKPIRASLHDAIREAEKRGREEELIRAWCTYGEFSARGAATDLLNTRIRTRKMRSIELSLVKYRWDRKVRATLGGLWLDERWVDAGREDNIRDSRYDDLVQSLQRAGLWTTDPNGLQAVFSFSQFPAHEEYGDRGYDASGVRVVTAGGEVVGVRPTQVPEKISRSISIVIDGRKIDNVPAEAFRSNFGGHPISLVPSDDILIRR